MNIERVKKIIFKDWKELSRSKQAVLPMVLVPLILVIILPVLIILISSNENSSIFNMTGAEQFITNIPAELFPGGLDERQKIIYAMIVYFFAPFFLIIPVMVSSVAASNSFVGEKERKTIEGLLYTPVSNKELILGKILVSFLPAILISWICFLVYSIIVNLAGSQIYNYFFFPTPAWIVLIFWLVPIISFLSLSLIVYISQKTSSVWEAQQISVLLLLPIIGIVVSQTAGLIYVKTFTAFAAGAVLFILDIFLCGWIVKNFNRESMLID